MAITDSLNTIAENVPKVYEAGKDKEKEEFWANFWNTLDGYYSYRFCGCGWTKDSFKPIYPNGIIQPTSAEKMFNFFNRNRSYNNPLVDMTEFCRHFDFSKATNVANIFDNARAKNITLDFSSATNLSGAFNSGNGGKFENIKLKVTENCTKFTNCFAYFRRQNPTTIMLTEDSVVAADIGCDSQRLSKESIKSFINALSPTTTDKVLTLHKKAVNAAFETSTGANDGEDSEEWANLMATKSNWTITLTTAV